MSLVVPAVHGIFGTGIRQGLASGTSRDVRISPGLSWKCQDWDSRGSSLWDLMGCPKLS